LATVRSKSSAQTYGSGERGTERVAAESIYEASFAYARITNKHYVEHVLGRRRPLHNKPQLALLQLQIKHSKSSNLHQGLSADC